DPYSVETFDVVPTDENGDCFTNDDGECLIQSFPKELATGTGTWSVQPSLTFLYPTDPAVFYGTVDYSFNLKNDFGGDIGEIDPGDAVGLSGGMGFGINDRSSFSMGFSYKHGFETKQEGRKLEGSDYDIGQMLFGYSFRMTQDTNVNLSVGVGVTDDAQDFELNLRVPTNFAL
ncbi:MAG: transporter, partial [Sedimenticolaceae bacterium]